MLALNSIYCVPHIILGFSCGSAGKESTCNAGDLGSILGYDPLYLRRLSQGVPRGS